MRWTAIALVACGGGSGGQIDGQVALGAVGRVCDIGDIPSNETVIASPALDCESRQCLNVANSQPAMCTVECVDTTDCSEAAESACTAGFACAPVVSVGPFACRSFCVCADRVPFTSCP
ncbi:MAG: hypothetical protein H0V17_03635 [Deltaproteobacteria bacterium]|nr:hypothetical protein [Deltaproteobacteria bacterium]